MDNFTDHSNDKWQPFILAEVTRQRIDLLQLYEVMRQKQIPGRYGAVVSFCGIVRSDDERVTTGKIDAITYETYEELFVGEKRRIIEEVCDHLGDSCGSICIVHRIDTVPVGDITAAILVTTIHQNEALEAISMLTKKMKERLPFWKRAISITALPKLIPTNPANFK